MKLAIAVLFLAVFSLAVALVDTFTRRCAKCNSTKLVRFRLSDGHAYQCAHCGHWWHA